MLVLVWMQVRVHSVVELFEADQELGHLVILHPERAVEALDACLLVLQETILKEV